MRIAFTGAGLRSSHVLNIFKEKLPDTEFVGYYDPSPSMPEKLGRDIPAYDSVEILLAQSKPDLLFVGSPNTYHLEHIRLGLQAGVRILTEKPVVTSIEDTYELCSLLSEYGHERVMVGLVLRYSEHMIDLQQAISDGQIGQISSIEANELIAPYHGAFFMRDWRRSTALSGGFMLEKCCHDLDLYNMITGSRPKRVASFGSKRTFLPQFGQQASLPVYHSKPSVWKNADNPFDSNADIIDSQNAIIEFESGVNMSFHTNLYVPDEHRRFCVIGTEGMAEGDFHRGYLRITRAEDNHRLLEKDYREDGTGNLGHYGADANMVSDIISYLQGEAAALPVSVIDALEAGIAALSIDQARLSGEIVDLTDVWQQFDSFNLRQTA
jgi:predicted dehydrogenase